MNFSIVFGMLIMGVLYDVDKEGIVEFVVSLYICIILRRVYII